MRTLTALPLLNAVLNSASAVLLSAGFVAIRRQRVAVHRGCMLAACATSVLFLASYLTYHAQVGSKPFPGQGPVRLVYFAILISHTVLAAAVVPLAGTTLVRALRAQWWRHRRLARWTLPLWLYVSVTGVVIYLMLYQLYPGA
ncbi:MAG: membrane protein [Candidatus Tectimicrobiota bacterium]|nr:MAG: membrane protein [Candidatus Tectomicrobia bacterium]